MYNEDIKRRFIEGIESPELAKKLRERLDKLSDLENKYGKDISEMTLEESINVANSIEFYEATTLEVWVSSVRKYVEWCKDNNTIGYCGGFLQLSVKDIDPSIFMSKLFFRDEQDLLRSILKVREFNDGYPEVISMVLAWAGLTFSQILDLKDDGIDLESRTIKDTSGEILATGLSDWVCENIHQYIRTDSGSRSNGTTTYEVIKDKTYDYFVKRFCTTNAKNYGERLTYSQLSSAIFKMGNQYESLGYPPRFTVINVKRSGALYRVWLLEQGGVDIEDKKNRELVERAYGEKKYLKIAWQYKYYKKAFNL